MEEKKLSWYTVRAIPKNGSGEYIEKDWFVLDSKSSIDVMMIFLSMELGKKVTDYLYVTRPKPEGRK